MNGHPDLETVTVPDPPLAALLKAVRDPLAVQQLQALLAQVQRLASSAHTQHNTSHPCLHTHSTIHHTLVCTHTHSTIHHTLVCTHRAQYITPLPAHTHTAQYITPLSAHTQHNTSHPCLHTHNTSHPCLHAHSTIHHTLVCTHTP